MTYSHKYARINHRDVGIRPCQNVIRGIRDDWADAHQCGEPAIDLGYNGERARCSACQMKTEAFTEALIERWAEAFAREYDVDEWLTGTVAIHEGMEDLALRFLREKKPLSKVYDLRRDLATRIRHMEAILSARHSS